jgi:DNA-binding transcriptional LysR family regulator
MDRLESMSILVTAAEAGSLSAAARRLGVPLATVSRKVSELEAALKTQLFIRSARRLSLTEAGEAYVVACRRILEEVEAAERAAAGEYSEAKGELALTAPIVFGRLHVLPIVTEFLKAQPRIDVRLTLADRVMNLLEERIDLAIRIATLEDSSLLATKVGAIRRIVCASPVYFAARGAPKTPADLDGHDCITFEGMSSLAQWSFAMDKKKVATTIHSRLTVTTAEAAIDAAIAGVGIARVFSYQAAAAVRTGALILALEDFEPSPWPVSLVRGPGLTPLKLRAFLEFATPRLKERLLQAAL